MINSKKYLIISLLLFGTLLPRPVDIQDILKVSNNFILERAPAGYSIDTINLQEFEDIKLLLNVLHDLTDKGNTIVVVEHNLDVIKTSDWIIDLGPDGGDNGGQIIAEGTPEQIIHNKKSETGKYLKEVLT